jgi:hypothetical protein
MKTTKLVLTTLAIFIVSIGIATDLPKMNIVPMSDKKAMVEAINAKSAFFELTIENQRGKIMYYKRSENPLTIYQKVFDFSNLENGSYAMKLRVNETSLAQNFQVTGNEVVPGDSQLQFDPYFSFKDNQLKFSYLNFEKENVKLGVYSNNKMIFKKVLGRDFDINSGLDLSKLEEGEYHFVLYSPSHNYTYDLKK